MLIIITNAIIIGMMMKSKTILKKLKDLLVANFGNDINSVILFGSQATGNAHKNSDYDVLIILNRDYDRAYRSRITGVVYDLELEHDIFIDKKIISTHELHNTIKGKHPMYGTAIQQGIHA
jgi:predicted nucleotidyltransferase